MNLLLKMPVQQHCNDFICFLIFVMLCSEAYSAPFQRPKIEPFVKRVNYLLKVNYFQKISPSILDVLQCSEYVCGIGSLFFLVSFQVHWTLCISNSNGENVWSRRGFKNHR